MFAVHRLARTSPQQAARHWTKLEENFAAEERAYVWGLIAYLGAMRHDPDALAWFRRAERPVRPAARVEGARGAARAELEGSARRDRCDDREGGFRSGVALLEGARAEGARPRRGRRGAPEAARGRVQFLRPARARGARRQDACCPRGVQAERGRPARDEPVAGDTARARALPPRPARRGEPRVAVDRYARFDDRQLLTAAEIARRNELYDRAINTADRTGSCTISTCATSRRTATCSSSMPPSSKLDEAWVYGLIRQESRFIADAKSRVGASGLMQLMPATAKWVAKKLGLKDWRWSQVTEVDTNVSLGT